MKLLEKINPFYKAVSVIISCLILAFTYSIYINIAVFIYSMILLLFFSNASKKSIAIFLIPVTITAVGMYFTGAIFGNNEVSNYTISIASNMNITSSYNGLQLASRIYAFCGLGFIFSLTTNSVEFVESLMQQGKLKPKFAYGIMASVNLLPNIKEEYENAKFALDARGVTTKFISFRAVFSMFVNAIFWADCLSIAMISKGFCEESTRIHYKQIHVSNVDILFLIIPQILLILAIVIN